MSAAEHDAPACDATITLAFSLLGKRWNAMIVDTLGDAPLTFGALRRAVTGISDAMLSDRLTELVDADLVAREVDPGPPVSVSYTLTARGKTLVPLLQQLGAWASANLSPSAGS